MARCPVCREGEEEIDGPRRCACGECSCAECCGELVDIDSLGRPYTELPHLAPILTLEADALRVQAQMWGRGPRGMSAVEQARYMDIVELVRYTARLAMGFDAEEEEEEEGEGERDLSSIATRSIFVPTPHAFVCCANCKVPYW